MVNYIMLRAKYARGLFGKLQREKLKQEKSQGENVSWEEYISLIYEKSKALDRMQIDILKNIKKDELKVERLSKEIEDLK